MKGTKAMAVERIINLSEDEPEDSVKFRYYPEFRTCDIHIPGDHLAATLRTTGGLVYLCTYGNWEVEVRAVVEAEKFLQEMLKPVEDHVLRKPVQ
jgi:hypothetical protein